MCQAQLQRGGHNSLALGGVNAIGLVWMLGQSNAMAMAAKIYEALDKLLFLFSTYTMQMFGEKLSLWWSKKNYLELKVV